MPAESYITRATVGSVVGNRSIFLENSRKYLDALSRNFITPRIDKLIDLKEAYIAHEILENRKNIGSFILKPNMVWYDTYLILLTLHVWNNSLI